jgi:GNAT superfamily N-acetyltransferase
MHLELEAAWRSDTMNGFQPVEAMPRSRAFVLPSGEPVHVRPIRPQDAGLLQAYLRQLSPETRRNRFLGALSELAPRELERLANMDRPGEVALLAFTGTGREAVMIGEALCVIAPDSARGEIALSVNDPWQRRGLGLLLMQAIECRARAFGARHLFGEVLRTNTAMKGLARKAGFSIVSPFTDARLIEIVKDLSLTAPGPLCAEQPVELPSIAA